jgi:hypothetical protein
MGKFRYNVARVIKQQLDKIPPLPPSPHQIALLAELKRAVEGRHEITIALSKARAARILLRADADYLQIPVVLKPDESEQLVREWIESFAFDALDAALEEAEAARQKLFGATECGAA